MEGILDFLKMFDDYEVDPIYSFYAVKAPFPSVVQEFFSRHDQMIWEKNIPKRRMTEDMCSDCLAYAVIEVLDSEWTIVLESVFFVNGDDEEARSMSECLNTRSLAMYEGDHGTRYDLFENGHRVECVDYGGAVNFESQVRDISEDDFDDTSLQGVRAFMNDTFVSEGIYVPACCPQLNDDVFLALTEDSEKKVGQVDLIYAD